MADCPSERVCNTEAEARAMFDAALRMVERDRYREALETIADTGQWLALGKTPGEIAREALDG